MLSKIKMVTVASAAVVALSAFGAVPALAGWLINGTTLTGSAALSTQALGDGNPTLLVPSLKLAIQCTGHFFDGLKPQLLGSDKAFAEQFSFLGCKTIEPTKCELINENNTSISTTAVLVLVAKGKGEAVNAAFTPEKGTTFGSISFSEQDTCAFAGEEPVMGAAVAGLPTGQLSLLAQQITGLGSTEGNNSLRVDGESVFIEGGRYLLTLASDSKWSFD
jgi:hypothetical protein